MGNWRMEMERKTGNDRDAPNYMQMHMWIGLGYASRLDSEGLLTLD